MFYEDSAVGEYAGRPLKAGDAAQPRGCSARFVPAGSGPVWITTYTNLAILCTTIKIMMRTAKKRALILVLFGVWGFVTK